MPIKNRIRILAGCFLLACLILTSCAYKTGELTTEIEEAGTTAEIENNTKESTAEIENETEEISTETENRQETLDAVLDEIVEDKNQHGSQNQITLCMVGDVLLHTKVQESGLQTDGSYNYDHLFAQVKEEIQAADISIVNQEVILGGTELGLSGYPSFNGGYEVGDALVAAGFDVVLHGTNHALDQGAAGILNCLNFWKTYYPQIGVLGINASNEQQDEIYVIEKNHIKIAILNYTFSTNGIDFPTDMPYAVNLMDEEKMAEDIEKAEEMADFTIVCPHWGTEYMLEPSDSQLEWCEFFAEAGVDLVLGTHPHVIEPIEWVESDNGNKMLVYYSLGNFINTTSGTGEGVANRMVGALAEITLTMEGKGEETQGEENQGDKSEADKPEVDKPEADKPENSPEAEISGYGVIPLVTQISADGKVTTYKLSEYTEEMGLENQIRLQDPDFTYEYCKKLCEKVFGDLYQQ